MARKLIIDTMHASVPLVVAKRTMKLDRLVTSRAARAVRPGWAAIIAKAFSIVARDEPRLRTCYLKWPWPRFYELPKSVGMIAVARDDLDKDAVVFVKVNAADEFALAHVEDFIWRGKHSPVDEDAYLDRVLRMTQLPLPLRRLLWFVALNCGRQRAQNIGTYGITSIAPFGSEMTVVRSPGPNVISYGLIRSDHTMDLLLHWDHRIYDGAVAARALQRLEEVLNGDIADELRAAGAPSAPTA